MNSHQQTPNQGCWERGIAYWIYSPQGAHYLAVYAKDCNQYRYAIHPGEERPPQKFEIAKGFWVIRDDGVRVPYDTVSRKRLSKSQKNRARKNKKKKAARENNEMQVRYGRGLNRLQLPEEM